MDRFTALITTNLVCRSRAVPSACAQLLWCRGLQGWKSSVARLSPWLGSLLPPHHRSCTTTLSVSWPRPAVWWCCSAAAVQISALMLIVAKSVISLKCGNLMFASTCVASWLGYQSGCWHWRGDWWLGGKMEFLIWLDSALITCACILNDETLKCRNVIQAWNLLLN